MGTIQTRKGPNGRAAYRAMVRLRGFAHQSRTFERRTDAKDWIRRTEQLIKDGNLPSTEGDRTTLHEALKRYAREVTPTKKDSARELNRIKVWQRDPLAKRFLSRLRGADFAAHRDKRVRRQAGGGVASAGCAYWAGFAWKRSMQPGQQK